MERVDVFAHVLLPKFYKKMLEIAPTIPETYPFFANQVLTDLDARRAHFDGVTKQVISYANCLPEDFCAPDEAARLCIEANVELVETTAANPDLFEACVALVPMNNIPEAVRIVHEQVKPEPLMKGIQVFTRALGKSIADPEFRPLFAACAEAGVGVWLHPVFDDRKPDNNLIFSWEYELSQAQLQLVSTGLFREFGDLKVIVHHAGAMAPFFQGRIDHILPAEQTRDFRRFYVDTAILGNTSALELACDYYGADHVLFGTDAPFGVLPAGATSEISAAIQDMEIAESDLAAIFAGNYHRLFD